MRHFGSGVCIRTKSVFRIRFCRPGGGARGRTLLLINRGLWSALNKASPQVIICGGYNYAASWEALLWARRHGVAFVLWSESNGQDARQGRAWVEFLKTYFLRHCDRFVVPGKASFEYLRSLGSPEASILTAPNAVDNSWFATQAENTRAHAAEFREKLGLPSRFILFVGRLVPEKGIFDLLEAYAKLESGVRSEVGLVFAGDGVSKEKLAQQAKRISPGTVCFPGFAQREDLVALYALAETLVLPTHSEPWGLVVNEAMACGLPIIVSERCRMFGRSGRRWVEWLRRASPRFGETQRGDQFSGAAT